MAIQKAPKRLDAEDIDRNDEITEAWANSLMRNLNALYEALFDDTAPSDSGQGYHGHDHFNGGGPICRGVSWSEDGGGIALYSLDNFTAAQQKIPLDYFGVQKTPGMCRYFGSPLFGLGSKLAGRLYYTAVNSDFTMFFVETSGNSLSKKSRELSIELPITGETGAWVDFEVQLNPGKWNYFDIYAENAAYDSDNAPVLSVFSVVSSEASGITRYRPSLLLSRLDAGLSQASSAVLTYAAFLTLDEFLGRDQNWMDTDLLSRIQWFANALFEGTNDTPAPGKIDQTVKGHDHEDYGGTNITRNQVAISACGQDVGQNFRVSAGDGEGNTSAPSLADATWIPADRDTGAGGRRSTAGVAMMRGDVSPGVTTLEAQVFLTSSPSTSIRVAIYNRTTTTWSSAVATTYGWLKISDIPASSDAQNEFDVYAQSTADGVTIQFGPVIIAETDVSQPAGGGASHLGRVPQGGA